MVEDAVFSAISHFNDGRISVVKLFTKLGIEYGKFTIHECDCQNMVSIVNASIKSTLHAKKNVGRQPVWCWGTLGSQF